VRDDSVLLLDTEAAAPSETSGLGDAELVPFSLVDAVGLYVSFGLGGERGLVTVLLVDVVGLYTKLTLVVVALSLD